MSLIKCPECGAMISDKAEKCPHCGYPFEKSPSHIPTQVDVTNSPHKGYSVTVPAIIGIVAYIVITVILSNVFNHYRGTYEIEAAISNDILYCSATCWVISWIIAKSNLDRALYFFAILIICGIAISFWEELQYGTAIIVFITHFAIIIIASIKRNHPTMLSPLGVRIME